MPNNAKRKKPRRHFNKKLYVPLGVLAAALAVYLGFKCTEDGTFTVLNYSEEEPVVATYKHFAFAKRKLESLDASSLSCIQNQNEKVVALQSGLVNFHTKDVSENTTYTTTDGEEGYLNGSYGSDALYLDTNKNGTKVLFMMAGVKGWVDVDDINLMFYDPAYDISCYSRGATALVHQVCTDLLNNASIAYNIGPAPDFLKEDTTYYSYDGHYFYPDFATMSADMQAGTYEHALNKEPYFNFYQFVPHRSKTALADNAYDEYLYRIRGIDALASAYPCADNESVLYDSEPTFIQEQNDIFVNGSMMFSLACNESAYGQSQYAIEQHNVFGHGAFDENPDLATMYADLKDCVHQHAYYFIQQAYANPKDWRYHGSWFGDKGSGINVQYASDPYWGEKAASMYYALDQGTDREAIQIHTVICPQDLDVVLPDGTIAYTYKKGTVASFVVVGETDEDYEVMLEAPVQNGAIDVNATYDPDIHGRIKK